MAKTPKSKTASKSKSKGAKKSARRVDAEVADEESTPVTEPILEDLSDSEVPNENLDDVIDISPSEKKKKALPAVPVIPGLVSTDPLVLYLAELKKYPLLTPAEEREIAIRYKETGDKEAAEKLVTSNLRFVVKVAAEYSKFGARMIDLIQEGNVGLMHAVKEFNPYKGVRLITYAVWWIRGYIREYLLKQYSIVRLGTTHNQKKLFYNLQQEEKRLDALGQEVSIPLLSSRLGIPEDEVAEMQKRLHARDLSLDQPFDENSNATLGDLQSSSSDEPLDVQIGRREELHQLHEKIDLIRPQLNEKEAMILETRILSDEPLTLQEIGDKMGITRERARQIESRVITKIKEALVGVEEN